MTAATCIGIRYQIMSSTERFPSHSLRSIYSLSARQSTLGRVSVSVVVCRVVDVVTVTVQIKKMRSRYPSSIKCIIDSFIYCFHFCAQQNKQRNMFERAESTSVQLSILDMLHTFCIHSKVDECVALTAHERFVCRFRVVAHVSLADIFCAVIFTICP